MSSGPQRYCKSCDRPRTEERRISYRGLCWECGELRQIENLRQLRAHGGPFARHHRLRIIAAWGGVPAEIVTQRAR